MKKTALIALTALAAIAVLVPAGNLMANDSATVTVTANVVGTCKFVSPKTGAVSFGALDPSAATDVAGTVTQPQFWCTKGAAYTISDDNGLNETGTTFRMVHGTNAAEFIPYSFTYTASGTGTGPQSPFTMDIAAQVLGASYANALAGAYSDTVTLTINP
ncbi:MAG TPA: spore coat protein U domain-containing protein [Thermoanaerobaculia bacterium]|nr:spore coat protein U domain-containing protein [Thermoanaerobaculia bacterium]HQN07037.1 spore coat protein U domain-containing protein [Thermoanaerobaculia bacterium]HQP87020.1 spore coat protein U domain-containing protein [Thermoanaerobaculia bacterium]